MHTTSEKKKLLARIRRIRGQIEAVETALLEERGCYEVLQTVAAARGAMNGFLVEMIEDHLRSHVIDPHEELPPERERAVEELVDVVRAYVK